MARSARQLIGRTHRERRRRPRLGAARRPLHRRRRGLPAQGLEPALLHLGRGLRRRLHRRPRAPAAHPRSHGARSAARRGAHLQRRARPTQVLAADSHRRLDRRPDRPPGHRAGGLAGAGREPEPAHQGNALHRQQHRRHPLGLRPHDDQRDPVLTAGRPLGRRAAGEQRDHTQHPALGSGGACCPATASCRSCGPTTRSPA